MREAYDAFAARLDSGGNLTWNAFLGSSGDDYGLAIAVDGTGMSTSVETALPPGALRSRHMRETTDAFAAVISSATSPTEDLDWGDAPDPSYPTLSANNGASHVIVDGMYLGAAIDKESDGQPNASATGDDIDADGDDEDGVVFTSPLVPGHQATLDVTASLSGYLDGWLDFNDDGDWADAGEQLLVSQPLAAGVNHLSFNVPAGAAFVDYTFARFRYSTAGGLSYTGGAEDGEVGGLQD